MSTEKNDRKFFPALLGAVLLVCASGACDSARPVDGTVDLRKVSDGKIPVSEFYERIEILPLDRIAETSASEPVLSDLCVAGERFVFRADSRKIVTYRRDGRLADVLEADADITDFSVYREEKLDILSGNEMREYDFRDLSLLRKIRLDTAVTPLRLARRSENLMILLGYRDDTEYVCEYLFDTGAFYASPGPVRGGDVADIVGGIRFLRDGENLLFLYPHNGQLWRCADFVGHFLWPEFKRRDADALRFLNAQPAGDKVYYALSLNGETCLLVFDRPTGRSLLVRTFREGLSLPLGVIRDGVDYFCCPASDLPRYVRRELLDRESAEAMDAAIRDRRNVVIKYHLRPDAPGRRGNG